MNREEFVAMLKDVLTFETHTSENYTGSTGDGPLYVRSTTMRVLIDGEIIAEVDV